MFRVDWEGGAVIEGLPIGVGRRPGAGFRLHHAAPHVHRGGRDLYRLGERLPTVHGQRGAAQLVRAEP